MSSAERQELARQVVQFYSKIANFNKFETVFSLQKAGD